MILNILSFYLNVFKYRLIKLLINKIIILNNKIKLNYTIIKNYNIILYINIYLLLLFLINLFKIKKYFLLFN